MKVTSILFLCVWSFLFGHILGNTKGRKSVTEEANRKIKQALGLKKNETKTFNKGIRFN